MWGMTCLIQSVGFWLILASYLELPVSTTHSAVGAIIGMTIMARSSDCVHWYEKTDEFPFMEGVAAIRFRGSSRPWRPASCRRCFTS